MKHTLLTAASLLLLLASCAPASQETGELAWPEITRQNKPWTRWWWPASAVGQADIDTMLQQYDEAGLGGMEITTIYGAKGYEDKYLDYLSPEWMDLFSYTLKEAEKRDLGIDLANASGWPFGGPWVEPEDACRYLAHKTWKLQKGQTIADKMEYIETPLVRTVGERANINQLKYPLATNDNLQQHAFDQVRYPLSLPLLSVTAYSADGQYKDLSSLVNNGKLNWAAPDGEWTVCALFLGWHGKMVERAGPGGEGDVIDHFSGRAITNYLKRFDEAFKGYDVSTIRYYFNDSYEVDDAQGNSDWTEGFFNEFQNRRGYDLKPHIAELLGISGDKQTADRVVFDYRTTIGELLLEKYSMMWQEWAARQGKGIRNQAHGSPANILDLYSVSDVPETEGRSIIGMKTASSAAHVSDKLLTSSESATWLNEHFLSDLGDVKESIDTYFLSGVNHIFYHGTCLSPNDAPWPGWLFYAAVHFQPTNSFWTDFAAVNRYVAHCQSFLQAGKPDNDILLFFDATDLLSVRGREQLLYHMNQNTPAQSAIGQSANYLYNKGYTWDYITDKMLLERVKVRNGQIVTNNGTSYKTIIIPKCDKMLLSSFERLMEMARQGATIIVEEALPADVPGLSNLESNRKKLAELKASLKFSNESGVEVTKVGKGRIMVSDKLDAMIALAGITRETMYDLGLQCISRVKDNGGKYYFIKNASDKTIHDWIPLDSECGTVAIFNPMTDEFGYAQQKSIEGGKQKVLVRLLPGESILMETFKGEFAGIDYNFYEPDGQSITLDNKWDIRFTLGGPELPAEVNGAELGTWTKYGEEYSRFSGTAEYRTKLEPQNVSNSYYMLDLGDVSKSASVWLNGWCLGTLIEKPFELVLTKEQLASGGELIIKVSNSMENRISWMDRNGMPWKNLYNANIAARLPQNRGRDGFFTAERWDVVDSGLIGPVTLTPLKLCE